jgi:hypothetical protein
MKVSEMTAEYFAPKEDIILQNEAPSDFYIVVTGIVVKKKIHSFNSPWSQIVLCPCVKPNLPRTPLADPCKWCIFRSC